MPETRNFNFFGLGNIRSMNVLFQMFSCSLCLYARITHTNSLCFLCIRRPPTFFELILLPFSAVVRVGRLASGFVFCSCCSIGEACQPNAVADDWLRVGHWRVWGNQHVAYTRAAVTSGASPPGTGRHLLSCSCLGATRCLGRGGFRGS